MMTVKCQGWQLCPVGAQIPASMIVSTSIPAERLVRIGPDASPLFDGSDNIVKTEYPLVFQSSVCMTNIA